MKASDKGDRSDAATEAFAQKSRQAYAYSTSWKCFLRELAAHGLAIVEISDLTSLLSEGFHTAFLKVGNSS